MSQTWWENNNIKKQEREDPSTPPRPPPRSNFPRGEPHFLSLSHQLIENFRSSGTVHCCSSYWMVHDWINQCLDVRELQQWGGATLRKHSNKQCFHHTGLCLPAYSLLLSVMCSQYVCELLCSGRIQPAGTNLKQCVLFNSLSHALNVKTRIQLNTTSDEKIKPFYKVVKTSRSHMITKLC